MKIITYATELDTDKKNILVKEKTYNYLEAANLCDHTTIANMLNQIFHANMKAEEYVWLIALDTKNNPIGIFEVTHGTVNASLTSPREIFIRLCLCGATNFILAHNHPSMDSTPSKDDINTTKRLKEAGELMNIHMLDHIIIGMDIYSFYEHHNVF